MLVTKKKGQKVSGLKNKSVGSEGVIFEAPNLLRKSKKADLPVQQ